MEQRQPSSRILIFTIQLWHLTATTPRQRFFIHRDIWFCGTGRATAFKMAVFHGYVIETATPSTFTTIALLPHHIKLWTLSIVNTFSILAITPVARTRFGG